MKDYIPQIRDYFNKLQDVLTKVDLAEIAAIAEVLHTAYEQQRTILVMGNGGSGATASHMVCDLNKGACFHSEKKFRLIALTDCTPMIPIPADTSTSTHIALCGVANLPCMAPRISGISSSLAMA